MSQEGNKCDDHEKQIWAKTVVDCANNCASTKKFMYVTNKCNTTGCSCSCCKDSSEISDSTEYDMYEYFSPVNDLEQTTTVVPSSGKFAFVGIISVMETGEVLDTLTEDSIFDANISKSFCKNKNSKR